MNCPTINIAKFALLTSNLIFLLSGMCLVFLGCILANDTPRVLLSRLALETDTIPQPLLYYVAIGFICLGMFVIAVGVLGCWAGWVPHSGCLLAMYMFLLVVLLLAETSFGVVSSLCPQLIGVNLDRDDMVSTLMNSYGVPGNDQYTAAVDLAQTLFECCGMQSGSDYDGSVWWKREKDNSHDLRVPRSCCLLNNTEDSTAFLDPKPLNETLCQAKNNARYQLGRHVTGCIDKLNLWFQEHINIFLIIGSALVIVQLSVLMCAILVCVRRGKTPPTPSPAPEPPVTIATVSRRARHSDNDFTPRDTLKPQSFYGGNLELAHASLPLKQLNVIKNDELYGSQRNAVPLVLRNDHFHESTKNNSQRRRSKQQETFFAPAYGTRSRRDNEFDLSKDFFRKNEDFYTADYNRFQESRDT